jgi:hypothetical protein
MIAQAAQLNPTQVHLLRMFSVNKSEDAMRKLKKALFEYYCHEVERMGTELAAQQNLTDERLEAMSFEHHRLHL